MIIIIGRGVGGDKNPLANPVSDDDGEFRRTVVFTAALPSVAVYRPKIRLAVYADRRVVFTTILLISIKQKKRRKNISIFSLTTKIGSKICVFNVLQHLIHVVASSRDNIIDFYQNVNTFNAFSFFFLSGWK